MCILRKTALAAGVLLFCTKCIYVHAQDIHLSQFYETPLLRNPALAGIFTGDVRVQAVYRNQWNSVTIPYQTGALSGEMKFHIGHQDDFITAGLQFTYDVAGASHFQTTQVLPAINYHKSLSDARSMYLSLGFMGGFTQRQFNPQKLTFDNQYNGSDFDPGLPSGEMISKYNYLYADGAVGLSFSSTIGADVNYFIGASYYHFNRPKVSFMGDESVELNPKWEYNAGLTAPLGDFTKIILQYNQLKQGIYSEEIGGALVGYAFDAKEGPEPETKMIYGGLFVRWGDAVIPVIKLEMRKYEVAFSYDVNVSRMSLATKGFGGFELSLSYKGFSARSNSSLYRLRCPRF